MTVNAQVFRPETGSAQLTGATLKAPAVTATLVNVTGAVPVESTVNVCDALELPTTAEKLLRVFVLVLNEATGATAEPLKGKLLGVFTAELTTVSAAPLMTPVANGVYCTVTAHD